jgi:hypothetical protein
MKILYLFVFTIISSIGIFFGSNIFFPFPYGMVLGIVVPAAIIWCAIKNPKREEILDVFLGRRARYIRKLTTEIKIQYAIVTIFLFGFISSVLYPFVNDLIGVPTIYQITTSEGGWTEAYANPGDKDLQTFLDGVVYRSELLALFIVFPIYLVPPALLILPRAIFWILSIISILIVIRCSAGLSNRRRLAYTYLTSVQIAGMWAPFFVWHPIYDHTIIPGI